MPRVMYGSISLAPVRNMDILISTRTHSNSTVLCIATTSARIVTTVLSSLGSSFLFAVFIPLEHLRNTLLPSEAPTTSHSLNVRICTRCHTLHCNDEMIKFKISLSAFHVAWVVRRLMGNALF